MKTIILFILLTITALPQSMLMLMDDGTDVTPPSVPQNLLAVGGTGENVLTWDANTESDLYGYVIYRDSLGAELTTNGTFDTDTWWGKSAASATIADGVGHFISAAYGVSFYKYSAILTIGETYRVEYTISNYSEGAIAFSDGTATLTARDANGTFIQNLVSQNIYLYFQSQGTSTLDIDNASIKEHVTTTDLPDIPIDTVLAGTETYTDTDVSVGVTYSYRLKALDNAGNLSDYSAKAEGIPE